MNISKVLRETIETIDNIISQATMQSILTMILWTTFLLKYKLVFGGQYYYYFNHFCNLAGAF